MQGLKLLLGERPKSKKAVKEAIANHDFICLEATSFYGNEYDGLVYDAPDGSYHFVGPDPFTKRNFYGTITVKGGKVSVK